MGLSLTVLGCSGSYPGPGAACSGYLVRSERTTIWVDAGSGTMANLQRHVPLSAVDAVVLTHEHPDHWADIDGFQVALAYDLDRSGIPVFAPDSVRGRTYSFNKLALDWRATTDGSTATVGDIEAKFARTDHEPETLAVGLSCGDKSLAYSADTGPTWSFDTLGSGFDLVLCEATFLESQARAIVEAEGKVSHLNGRQAGELARDAGAARLLLTHFWPGNDREQTRAEAEASFGASVDIAIENEEYQL